MTPKLFETVKADNWRQGSYGWGTERLCLGAHIRNTYGIAGLNDGVGPVVRDAIMTLYPDRIDPYYKRSFSLIAISIFNDHPATTLGDVLRVLKCADA